MNKPNYQLRDLTGNVFGRLLVKQRGEKTSDGKSQWVCVCTCPDRKEVVVRQRDLLRAKVNSCGCIKRQMLVERNTTHGASSRHNQTPEYTVWRSMHSRCNSDVPRVSKNYKELGVKICERWAKFDNFLDDMGNRPSPMHTLDRIEGALLYSKETCKWSTYQEQADNRRSTHMIEMNGKKQSLKRWCEELSLPYQTILARVNQHNWAYERALTTPVRHIDRRAFLYS